MSVGEAAGEVDVTTGAVVHAFATGTVVQVFQLAQSIAPTAWNSQGVDGGTD